MFRNVLLAGVVVAITLSVSLAFAGKGGNPRKGKYLWKKDCKTCHVDGGEAQVLSPSSKTQKEWDHFFEKNTDVIIMEKCKKFSDSNLNDIQKYMNDHAVDSGQPETCG